MNLLVLGWYHHQNAGDDRLQRALTRLFDGHTLAFLPAGRPLPRALLHDYDGLIIGGGGLIMKRGGIFKNVRRWWRATRIPVALVGVSVERFDEALAGELNQLTAVALMAWFRDRGSAELLAPAPSIVVAPDASWIMPYAPLAAPGEGLAVNLSPRGDLDPDRWGAALAGLQTPLHPWPLYFERRGDCAVIERALGRPLTSIEFDMTPLDRARWCLTSRYHGVQFALQRGRPFLAIGDQPKTRRFLEERGLTHLLLRPDRPEELAPRLRTLDERYGDLLGELQRHRQDLCRTLAPVADELLRRMTEAARRCGKPLGPRLRRRLGL